MRVGVTGERWMRAVRERRVSREQGVSRERRVSRERGVLRARAVRAVGATALAVGSAAVLAASPAYAGTAHTGTAHTGTARASTPHPSGPDVTVSHSAGSARGPSGQAPSGATLWFPGSPPPSARSGMPASPSAPATPDTPGTPASPGVPAGPGASASPWSVSPTPNPAGLANGSLLAESCAGAHACTAVGDYVNNHGTVVPLAEAWNGTRWTIQTTPVPPGSTSTQLTGVSCPALAPAGASRCVAAGYYTDAAGVVVPLAETWNGTRWTVQATPVPPGATASGFFGIACGAPASCTAAGDYVASGGDEMTLAEHWNGKTWAIQTTPNPAGATDSGLFGVTCARTTCTATGAWSRSSGDTMTLAERWNGTKWTVQTTPSPAGAYISELTGVSCPSASVCVAAGYHQSDTGASKTLAERWNGTTWAIQTTATPSGATGSGLATVSCPAVNACTAVGGYNTANGDTMTLAEAWNGTKWTVQTTANVTGTTASELDAVSCPVLSSTGTGDCVAAGASQGGSGTPVPLAEDWNGKAWAIQRTPSPSGARSSELVGVSCPAANACEAVGNYTAGNQDDATLAEAWNGTKWTIQPTPNPAKSGGSTLDGVSCPATGGCEAVGSYYPPSGNPVPLAETWNGTTWAIQTAPAPAGAQSAFLYSVSCGSPHACLAVGTYNTKAGPQVAFAERWNGTAWAIQTLPTPAKSGGTSLQSVSCTVPASAGPAATGANACEAVGSYVTSAGEGVPLAEAWNGTKWSLQTVPMPSGSQGGSFDAVSCTAPASTGAKACTGTGTYYANPGGAFAEGWNGKTWTFEAAPNPPDGGSSSGDIVLGSVSCVSAQRCFAVGNYNPGQTTAAFADTWNGTKWSEQAPALPPGAGGIRLNGVSCTATRCAAVGDYFGTANMSVTLAESRPVS